MKKDVLETALSQALRLFSQGLFIGHSQLVTTFAVLALVMFYSVNVLKNDISVFI